MPSRWEGLPYVVLEAMAARRPVVATPVDGSRELVDDEHRGPRARPRTPRPWRAAAARLLAAESPVRAALGARAAERVERGYTLDTMVAKTRAVYAEVA